MEQEKHEGEGVAQDELAEEARAMAAMSQEYLAMAGELAELNALEEALGAQQDQLGGVFGTMVDMMRERNGAAGAGE